MSAKTVAVELQELREQLTAKTTELVIAAEAVGRLTTEAQTSKDLLTAATSDLTKARADLTTAQTSVADLTGKLEEAGNGLVIARQEAAEAMQRATEKLAGAGAPPLVLEPMKPSADELWMQYRALKDPTTKNEFYAAHRDAMTPRWQQAK